MKLLVTGGKGFIGSHLVKALINLGHVVETLDLVDKQDIRDLEQAEGVVKDKQAVFHLAAVADLNWARMHPRETVEINVGGTANVVNACSKFSVPLYFASTCGVYGNQKIHPSDETTVLNPAEIYACTKLAGEYIIKGYGLLYGLQYNLMRFGTVYGPRMGPASGVYIFFKQAINNEPITVHGDGKQTRTLTCVSDLVDGVMMLFQSKLFVGAINLAGEEEISANEMAEKIKKLTGSKSKIIHVAQRAGQIFRESIDNSKAKKLLSWNAKIPFEDGLVETYNWFKNR